MLVRDAATGAVVLSVNGDAPVSGGWSGEMSVAVSPDGRKAAVRTWRLRVVDLATGSEVFSTQPGKWAGPLAFSPDGAFLLHVGDDGKSLVVRDTATWAAVRELAIGQAGALAFTPDGSRVVVGGPTLRVVEFASGRVLSELQGDGYAISRIALSRDGGTIAALRGVAVRTFDLASGAETPPPAPFLDPQHTLAWSHDGRRLAVGDGRAIHVCDARSGRLLTTCRIAARWITGLDFSDDDRRLIVQARTSDAVEMEIDAATGAELARAPLPVHAVVVTLRAGSRSGHRIALAYDKPPRLLDLSDGTTIGELSDVDPEYPEVQLDGDSLVVAKSKREFVVRDAATAEVVARFAGPAWTRDNVGWYAERGRVVVWDDRSRIEVLDARSGRRCASVAADVELHNAEVAPDAGLVAAVDSRSAIRLFDGATGRELAVLAGHRGDIGSTAFSPDGRLLATSATDGTVLVWDAAAAAGR